MVKYRRQLWEHALGNYGFVTTEDAEELGVPAVELRKLAARGGLAHVAYGIYRFDDAPADPNAQMFEAVLRVGPDAHLTGDAVLALHDLALVNPRRIRVGLPRRTRAKLPAWIEVIRQDLPPEDLTVYEGIPSTTVARALIDARGAVIHERLYAALEDATRRGLVTRRERRRAAVALGEQVHSGQP